MMRPLLLCSLLCCCGVLAQATACNFTTQLPSVLVFGDVGMAPVSPAVQWYWGASLSTADGTLTITRGDTSFTCTPGSRAARRNGAALTLPLAPFARAGVTYVPMRPLIDALGGTMQLQTDGRLRVILPNLPAPLTYTLCRVSGSPAAYRDDDRELYAVNLDGSGACRLTYNTVHDYLLDVAPNGASLLTRKVVAAGQPVDTLTPPAYLDLHMKSSPSGFPYLFTLPDPYMRPSWDTAMAAFSSDGEYLVYSVCTGGNPRQPNDNEVYLYHLPKKTHRPLGAGVLPRCSPDGRYVTYNRFNEKTSTMQVWLAETRGSGAYAVGYGYGPRFSPRGDMLLFSARLSERRLAEKWYRRSIDATGNIGATVPLVADPAAHEECFSPDERQIAFVRSGQDGGLFLVDAAGQQERRLTQGANDRLPTFTPDGKEIAFARESAFYAIRTDGTGLRKLADCRLSPQSSRSLLITPNGAQLLYEDFPELPTTRE